MGRKAEHLLVRLREAEKAISPPHQLYHTLPWLRERVPFFYRAGGGLSAPMPPQGGGLLVPKLVSEEGLPGGTCAHTTEAAREGPGDGTVVAQEEWSSVGGGEEGLAAAGDSSSNAWGGESKQDGAQNFIITECDDDEEEEEKHKMEALPRDEGEVVTPELVIAAAEQV